MVKEFILTRIFDAPLDLVWKCFTQPEYMTWWGPKGVKSGYLSMSFKPGGRYHYYMDDDKGNRSYGRMVFKEIVPKKRLVFIDSFSDKKGGLTRHPLSAKWPLEMLTTYEFSENKGKTKFTIHWIPVNANAEEEKTFDSGRDSMTNGWTGTLDRLDEYLKSAKKQKITPFLWFDHNAEEAVKFYVSVFKDSKLGNIARYGKEGFEFHKMPEGSVMTVDFEIEGQRFTALNGGPVFKINPSVSFFVYCKTEAEITGLWKKLSEKGKVMMKFDKYPFAEKYGWVEDKFGVSWQLFLSDNRQKILPCLMFCGMNQGKAEAAINEYISIFPDSKMMFRADYEKDQAKADTKVMHAKFSLGDYEFIAMDSAVPQPFTFNEAISLMVNCKDQEEIDYYWKKLSAHPEAEQCGWLKDKYGVSWQIIPSNLGEIMSKNPGKAMNAMFKMKKIDIKALIKAQEV